MIIWPIYLQNVDKGLYAKKRVKKNKKRQLCDSLAIIGILSLGVMCAGFILFYNNKGHDLDAGVVLSLYTLNGLDIYMFNGKLDHH